MGLASGRFEANAWYLEQFYRNLWGVIVFYTTFATSTRLGNVENKTIIYIYAADIPAVVSYDIRYLSVYCVDAISLAIHRDMVGKGLGIPVLAEMFMYAALFLVPMALPLAILLAH